VILVSLFSGYLVRIYSWRTILGREGVLNSALLELGVIDAPLTFLVYSSWSVVLTLAGMLIPLAVLPIYASMSNVGRDQLEGAQDLGSRGLHLHRTVLVPMVLPGLSSAFAIAFILAAGDFVVPLLIGGTQGVLIGNIVADQFRGLGANWPLGSALSFVVVATMLVLYLVTTRLVRTVTRW
jgi:spermidine/putrescine transport system permease protein